MRAEVVGRPAADLAARAGFAVPPRTRLLVAAPDGIGLEHPLSHEILAPVLAWYPVADYAAALATCEELNHLGGVGHTVGLYAEDEAVVADFARMNAGRIVVNTPSTEGAIGGIFNSLRPSLTLACGTGAGNLDTDNITVHHLLNVHRVARRKLNRGWLDVPRSMWLDAAVEADEIRRLYGRTPSA
jgi:acetaldehyde dehydrogenase/alcohol dehydrogenase